MDNVIRRLKKMAQTSSRAFDAIFDDDPLMIMPYRGYASQDKLFLRGRVLEDENIFEGQTSNELWALIEQFKRFESDEVEGARLGISLLDQYQEVETDEEGFFTIDQAWETSKKPEGSQWEQANLTLLEAEGENNDPIHAIAEVFFPSLNSDYGIISDIDDTVLQTHVTSRFKLKMIYAIFFQDASQRLPMEGIVNLYQQFAKGGDGTRSNPIFYVSNSPWNLYDLIEAFMRIHQLPKGPILLRDIDIAKFLTSSGNSQHKLERISHILDTYPHLPFILLGDTGSKDADYYLAMADAYPNRILAIYIRNTKNTRNAKRVEKLINEHSFKNAILVKSSQEIIDHAMKKGFIV